LKAQNELFVGSARVHHRDLPNYLDKVE